MKQAHVEIALIIVNIIMLLYLVYCYTINDRMESFHEVIDEIVPHNHYDGNTSTSIDQNSGCVNDVGSNVCEREGQPIRVYVYDKVQYHKCWKYDTCPDSPYYFVPCHNRYHESDDFTCIHSLLDHKRSPFMDDADLKSDPLAVNALGTSLVVHDIRDTFSLSDYRKYFYINKSKLFDTNNTVNYFLPEDYKIYSKADKF